MRETSAPDANVEHLCPPTADLLCASTSELPDDEQRDVSRHLEACPSCQAKLRGQQAVLVFVAANADDLKPTARLTRITSRTGWLALAAAVLLLVGLFGGFLRNPDVARADEILARLAQNETHVSRPDGWYLWTVIVPSRGLNARGAIDSRAPRDNTQAAHTAEALLNTHGFVLRDPFSLSALQAWRSRQSERREHVAHRDGEIVVTITGSESLREIEIVIDPVEFVAVSQRWTFPGVGQVECSRPKPNDAPGTSR